MMRNFDWILTGSHHTADIASAYYPEYKNIYCAKRKFRNDIEKDISLLEELAPTGYTKDTLMLTPLQIDIIIHHWGLPDMPKRDVEHNAVLRHPKTK